MIFMSSLQTPAAAFNHCVISLPTTLCLFSYCFLPWKLGEHCSCRHWGTFWLIRCFSRRQGKSCLHSISVTFHLLHQGSAVLTKKTRSDVYFLCFMVIIFTSRCAKQKVCCLIIIMPMHLIIFLFTIFHSYIRHILPLLLLLHWLLYF